MEESERVNKRHLEFRKLGKIGNEAEWVYESKSRKCLHCRYHADVAKFG